MTAWDKLQVKRGVCNETNYNDYVCITKNSFM